MDTENAITQKVLKTLFVYNDDGSFTKIKSGKVVFGSNHQEGYKLMMINYKMYRVHRLVFLYHKGFMPEFVDHIDGNPANNIIENLRECSRSENSYNAKKLCTNSSGVKGLHFCSDRDSWKGQIIADKKVYNFRSTDKKEVIKWLKNKREELHGNFARY
jgi:hypothetical protein